MEHSCGCSSQHKNDCEIGSEFGLYEKINKEGVECLNERVEGSGVTVFKPWEERLNKEKFVESDEDPELLFKIPFTGNVKLKGIIVIGGSEDDRPCKMRLYKNRELMTFDETASTADQEFGLVNDSHGLYEHSVNPAKFSSVEHLTIHFVGDPAINRLRIEYIGLRGEWTPAHRHGVTICSYESRPQISDHKQDLFDDFSREIQ